MSLTKNADSKYKELLNVNIVLKPGSAPNGASMTYSNVQLNSQLLSVAGVPVEFNLTGNLTAGYNYTVVQVGTQYKATVNVFMRVNITTLGAVNFPFEKTVGFYCTGQPLGLEHKNVI